MGSIVAELAGNGEADELLADHSHTLKHAAGAGRLPRPATTRSGRVMGRLDGRVALITGASRGFGRATAVLLAREGADIVLNYRAAADEARATASEAEAAGRQAVLIQADVADPQQAESLGRRALDALGRVDVLVSNAGVMNVSPFATEDPAQWQTMLNVNVMGTIVLTRAVLPAMIERKHGRIICLSSQLGHVGGENFAVYSGTKGFILAFTKSLAREVGQHGITVNAVCPGSILTDMNRSIYPPERQKARAAELPLRRLGQPSDVAEAVLYLASDAGQFVTGTCLDVNGGATMV
jgi:NAD(P)-dependent dehydrogenase (short-subunit alcohol dehydrogenase family)